MEEERDKTAYSKIINRAQARFFYIKSKRKVFRRHQSHYKKP